MKQHLPEVRKNGKRMVSGFEEAEKSKLFVSCNYDVSFPLIGIKRCQEEKLAIKGISEIGFKGIHLFFLTPIETGRGFSSASALLAITARLH